MHDWRGFSIPVHALRLSRWNLKPIQSSLNYKGDNIFVKVVRHSALNELNRINDCFFLIIDIHFRINNWRKMVFVDEEYLYFAIVHVHLLRAPLAIISESKLRVQHLKNLMEDHSGRSQIREIKWNHENSVVKLIDIYICFKTQVDQVQINKSTIKKRFKCRKSQITNILIAL